MHKQYGHLKEKRINEVIEHYIELVTNEIWCNWRSHHYLIKEVAFVHKNHIYNNSKRLCLVKGSKKQTYMDKWFTENCPLYKVEEIGRAIKTNTGKTTDSQLTEIVMLYELKINGLTFDEYVKIINDVNTKLTAEDKKYTLKYMYGKSYEKFISYQTNPSLNIADVIENINTKGLKPYILNKKQGKLF